ncbi:hypothetical protein GCM10011571_17910 [Marinithermofilum abyssi]|uniref:DUF177 domain-containing protein n=1 Tax=Marinithermofilum abyssi TaxID=1571185 RepID=A0A8J2Y975_9BACL|nr:DUF177 domain-containing protein [Marinithermofilum abyssi]GGE16659.1 hypothetical protein GCM10011571_17910 [Marinithermofilum abyssi]
MLISFRKLNRGTDIIEQEDRVELKGAEREHPDLVHLEPVKVRVQAWKDGETYHVHGRQSTEAEFRCSRCLTTFSRPLSMEWHRILTDAEPKEDEEDAVQVDPDQPVDVTPFIREALLLEFPLAPVCREDCKGLCPACGVNRNEQTCQCDTRPVDPRLAKLQELLDREE